MSHHCENELDDSQLGFNLEPEEKEEENEEEQEQYKEEGRDEGNDQQLKIKNQKKSEAAIKFAKGVEKLNQSIILKSVIIDKKNNSSGNLDPSKIISMFSDKKKQKKLNQQMQEILNELDKYTFLDLSDNQTCQKPIKNPQEIQFLRKFIKQLYVFKQKDDILESNSLSNKIIQNLRSIFVKKHNTLFKYGDRGNEYFILLQGKAYCLIPYSYIFSTDQIKAQTKTKRLTPQVTEDPEDEDFLLDNCSSYQCVKIYKQGEAFGEIALLTSESKRMASIICKEDSWFMSLDKEGFNQVQGQYKQHLLNEKIYYMKAFDIFASVPVNKMLSFIMEMEEITYERNQKIYEEQQQSDKVYFLLQGDIELIKKITKTSQSKLMNQKYEQYFLNTRNRVMDKVVMKLQSGSYFGDEDLTKQRTLSAVCKSQSCILLCIKFKKLSQFLRVFRSYELFLSKAATKRENYEKLLHENILHPYSFQEASSEVKKEDPLKESEVEDSPNNITSISPQPNNNFKKTSSQFEDSIFKLSLPTVSKFSNVYTQGSNSFLKQKKSFFLKNIFQSSCNFQLEDVPMTTTMNQNQDEIKRQQFMLHKHKVTHKFNYSQSFDRKLQQIYQFACLPSHKSIQPASSKSFDLSFQSSSNASINLILNTSKDSVLDGSNNSYHSKISRQSQINSFSLSHQSEDKSSFPSKESFLNQLKEDCQMNNSKYNRISNFSMRSQMTKYDSIDNDNNNQLNISQSQALPFLKSQYCSSKNNVLNKNQKRDSLINSIFGSEYQENLLMKKILSQQSISKMYPK